MSWAQAGLEAVQIMERIEARRLQLVRREAELQEEMARIGLEALFDFEHHYLSTYCLHGLCKWCRLTCKICNNGCLCKCHREDEHAGVQGVAVEAAGVAAGAEAGPAVDELPGAGVADAGAAGAGVSDDDGG